MAVVKPAGLTPGTIHVTVSCAAESDAMLSSAQSGATFRPLSVTSFPPSSGQARHCSGTQGSDAREAMGPLPLLPAVPTVSGGATSPPAKRQRLAPPGLPPSGLPPPAAAAAAGPTTLLPPPYQQRPRPQESGGGPPGSPLRQQSLLPHQGFRQQKPGGLQVCAATAPCS